VSSILRVLFWSILAAAFIGPGTVTTAASAGARFGNQLLWALVFSTIATLVLQEAAARLSIATGADLGESIARRHGRGLRWLAGSAIVLGCAAYEAGNLLGGAAGIELISGLPRAQIGSICLAGAATLLWTVRTESVARLLGITVAIMGVCFLVAALSLRPDWGEIARGSFLPRLPPGSSTLALALVGTTVVPYNLFLGSSLAKGRDLRETRLGLAVAIVLGGIISMAIVIVGTALDGEMQFAALAAELDSRLGAAGPWLLGIGLFASGFSSALTAPLAASMATRSLFGREGDPAWSSRGGRSRAVWLGVLAFGGAVGLSGLRPVPVIVLAQLLNGLLLPIAAVLLWLAMRDGERLGRWRNTAWQDLLMAVVVLVSIALGAHGIWRSLTG
jgi:Mn2+/Fe2+ NRAMP family transporter